jgi:hypothetical protein
MAIVRSTLNGGKGLKVGDVSVNAYNVAPVAKVAGTDAISAEDLKTADFFNVTSSAATANITLNEDIPVGSQFVLQVGANGMEIVTEGATDTMNGGTAAQVIDIAASSSAIVFKPTATTYVVEQVTAAGARTAPTPAVDG